MCKRKNRPPSSDAQRLGLDCYSAYPVIEQLMVQKVADQRRPTFIERLLRVFAGGDW